MVEFLTCYTCRAAVCKYLDAYIKGRNVILECKLKLASPFLIYGLLTIVNLQYYMHSKTLHPPLVLLIKLQTCIYKQMKSLMVA